MAARRAAPFPRKPAADRRCGAGAYKMRPYNGKGQCVHVNAPDSRRAPAEPRRAACPHAAMAGPRRPGAMVVPAAWFGGVWRPALRTRLKPRRRGGLYGRPQGSSVSPQACGGPAVRRGRIYNAPLQRETAVRTCRGGLYIRPNRPAVPAAPPLNLVGRHAHMPPWPGRDDRGPWWSRRPGLAGCGAPPYAPG